ASWIGCGSSRRIEKTAIVPARNPAAKRLPGLPVGYVSQRGAATSAANFAQHDAAMSTPRGAGLEMNQRAQTSRHGMIASFVFELETYCVNGYAAHAKASTAPSRRPPKRSPTNQSPRIV